MRTPNTNCCICATPLYRRPKELAKIRYVACLEHRAEAYAKAGPTERQVVGLTLGRKKGTNNRVGYRHSEESKRKTSESHKQWCKINHDVIKARGEKNRGENHYKWKGGVSRLNASVRRLTENRKWMDAVKERDKKCIVCDASENLESHHITPLAELLSMYGITNREQARKCVQIWDISNGMTLCKGCHYKIHGRKHED